MAGELVWIDPGGSTTDLMDTVGVPALFVQPGHRGLGMPPRSFVDEEVPGQPGARLRSVKTEVRDVDLPIFVQETSGPALRTRLDALVRAFDPDRGDGILRATDLDGVQRDLTCRYQKGLERDDGPDTAGPDWRRFVLTLVAHDPYWYASTASNLIWALGDAAGLFFPILPWVVTSSTIFADAAIVNDGDVEAWPLWTITGPAVNPVLQNLTTGSHLVILTTLGIGESITIDTRPGHKAVTGPGGTNLMPALSALSSLWELVAGSNLVRILLSSATTDTRAQMTYTPKYLGARWP